MNCQPEKESKYLKKLQKHVQFFFAWFMAALHKAVKAMSKSDEK